MWTNSMKCELKFESSNCHIPTKCHLLFQRKRRHLTSSRNSYCRHRMISWIYVVKKMEKPKSFSRNNFHALLTVQHTSTWQLFAYETWRFEYSTEMMHEESDMLIWVGIGGQNCDSFFTVWELIFQIAAFR